MDPRLMLRVLALRGKLKRHEAWTVADLAMHQEAALRQLRSHAYARSPFYAEFHKGLERAPLTDLPILTKGMLMERFDDLATDRGLRLVDAEEHIKNLRHAERLAGRYYVAATAGTTGRRGVFAWDDQEWATVLASYGRPYGWGGADLRLTNRTTMAVVSSTTPWHQSALVGATVDSPLIRTLRVDSGDPVERIVDQLEQFQPNVLVGYASMLRLLAEEQLEGRLHIRPQQVFSASEVLTDETRRRVYDAWNEHPFNVYAATETAGIAAECEHHNGLHIFEDLVITEVVDDANRPVPPGEFGVKVLVTVLFSRTLPLIRYEMSDSLRLAPPGVCECGMPFARIDAIQGRQQEVVVLPRVGGGHVTVQPVVFHRVMDTVRAAAWQIVYDGSGITVLLAGDRAQEDDSGVIRDLTRAMADSAAQVPPIRVERVDAIPRTALGKAPLIRSTASPPAVVTT